MSVRCPRGHDSDEPDYCSVCGAAIASAPSAVKGAPSRARAGEVCPSCGEPRADADARFCEVCRFDFVAGKGATGSAPRLAESAPAPSRTTPFVASSRAWSLVVAIDPTLDTEPDPATPCPLGAPDALVDVDRDELLVGRRDDRRDIKPEIALHDPGASRRHAKIVRNADGSLALQDLASTNGTRLNGEDVPAGGRTSLRDGDAIVLGRWTRITVRARG